MSNNEKQQKDSEEESKETEETSDSGGFKKILRIWGLLAIGVFLFFIVFQFVGWDMIISSISRLNLFFFTLALICSVGAIVAWTLRWNLFLKERGHNISFLSLSKYLMVGLAINNVTPLAKFGGEPVRAYLLKNKEGIRMRKGFATVMAELSVMFIVLVGTVIFSLFLFFIFMDPPSWVAFLLIPFGAFLALAIFLIKSVYSGGDSILRFLGWIGEKIDRFEPYRNKIERVYKDFREAFTMSLNNRRVFTKAFILSISVKFFDIAKFFLLFKALGYNIGILEIVIMMGLNALLLSIPATPGSLGVLEGGLISVLSFLGVPTGIAATVVFLDRLVWFWVITIIGGTIGVHYGVSILESKKTEFQEAPPD